MHLKEKDGFSPIDHRRNAIDQNGEEWAEKNGVLLTPKEELAPEVAEIFAMFGDFNIGRNDGMSGPEKLTWEALYYWEHHRERKLEQFELDCFLKLDSIYRNVFFEKAMKK